MVLVSGACLNPRPEELPSYGDVADPSSGAPSGTAGSTNMGDVPRPMIPLDPGSANPPTETPVVPDADPADAGATPDAGVPAADAGAPAVE